MPALEFFRKEWKKVLAVLLGCWWAHICLNATEHFLVNVLPLMHGGLRFEDWPWPPWIVPWWQ